jgi:hypothetical protein
MLCEVCIYRSYTTYEPTEFVKMFQTDGPCTVASQRINLRHSSNYGCNLPLTNQLHEAQTFLRS